LPSIQNDKIQQGTYAELTSAGIMKKLSEPSADPKSQKRTQVIKDAAVFEELGGPDETELGDLSRKTGDFSVYYYYLKAIGVVPLSIFLFFAILSAFSNSFSSKCDNAPKAPHSYSV
jgi:ATP-binding cassette subfamily C (CFTR/MRP) protein 1